MLPNAYLCAELGEPTDPFEVVDKLIDADQLGPLVEADLVGKVEVWFDRIHF